ncbi:SWIM zinc finger family protein [Alkalicella caledoniensis]|uniref:SWIM zinc finger family protein n=1 Tax=Alkalicella caledoniensis TaxID=2731377 RepID=A0A7G9W5W9_ALKCA|nr:SWIM zinc finger family protein [Alkalicella caledoniensis]QNO14081.1 SWIM zinc finger family protein [Alkalicella caledoniensis]
MAGFPKYESAASKKAKAQKALDKARKGNPDIEPVIIEGRNIANTWWGKAWNSNLESYADYSNRIGRGKSYVRNNTVLDLKISKGKVYAKVQGSRSRPYSVDVSIDPLETTKWGKIIELCNNKIESLEQLLHGEFPVELEALFKEKQYGIFPAPREIHFDCSCPDWAYMCKHVAAVLYSIGARLDKNPMLFFELRDLDGQELVKKTMEAKIDIMLVNVGKKSEREVAEDDIVGLFGL